MAKGKSIPNPDLCRYSLSYLSNLPVRCLFFCLREKLKTYQLRIVRIIFDEYKRVIFDERRGKTILFIVKMTSFSSNICYKLVFIYLTLPSIMHTTEENRKDGRKIRSLNKKELDKTEL